MGAFLFDTDYANLAAALTAAAGRVLVISGTHVIATAHTVPADTRLVGDGGSITVNVNNQNALVIGGNGVAIEGVEIACSQATPPGSPDFDVSNGIFAESREDLTVKDCLIRGFYSCGIQLRNCRDASLRGNRLHGNKGAASESDICLYSGTAGGRAVIEGNFCLSNNSQGIMVDALGADDDLALLGNICVATDGGGDETGSGWLVRRHGILIGYNSPAAGNGRIAVLGNICRNSLWTGIYLATNEEPRRGVVVMGNVCSLNGLGDTALAGGIYINGGGLGTLIANNAVVDFRGTPAQDVGCLVVNHSLADASATLSGNVCDTSTADGIVLKGASAGVRVSGNRTFAIARFDLFEAPTAGHADYGGHRIEQNEFTRTNADHPAVFIYAGDSTRTTYVLDNVILGFDDEEDDPANTAILVSGGVGTKPIVAAGNLIRSFYNGIVNYGYIAGRYNDLLRFDRNRFEQCHDAIVLAGTATSPAMVVEGNRFDAVTNRLSGGGGLGGYSIGYIGRRDDDRLVLLGLNAAPSAGTWAVGDRAEFTAPTAGGTIGAVCTAAGNPGTWKTYGTIAA